MILVWNRYCEDAPVIFHGNASIQGSSEKFFLKSAASIYHAHHCSPGNASGWGHHLDALLYFKNLPSEPRSQFSQVSCFLFSVSSASRPLPLCISGSFPIPFPVRESSSSPGPCPLWHFFVPPEKMPLFRFSFSPFSHWLYARRQPDPGCMIPPFFKKQEMYPLYPAF